MQVKEYKKLQDLLENLEPYDYGNDVYIQPLERAKYYLDNNNVSFEEKDNKGWKYLELKFDNAHSSKFSIGKYPNNSFIGMWIANDKMLTDYYMKLNNVPSPQTKIFNEEDFIVAKEFLSQIDNSVVVKPKNLQQALGVTLNVEAHNFEKAWRHCINAQKKAMPSKPVQVVIQEQVDGIELRINVVEGKATNAIVKMPWVMEGDGKRSIKEIITDRNNKFKNHPTSKAMTIKITGEIEEYLEESGKTIDSILQDKELLMFSKIPVNRLGALKYDVRSIIHPNILKLAEDSVKATPGLHTGGIDLFVPTLDSSEGLILEVNKNPGTDSAMYPINGQPSSFLDTFFDTFLLEQKVIHEDIHSVNDITNDELEIILKRYKFLYEKDKMNTRIITKLHREFIDEKKK